MPNIGKARQSICMVEHIDILIGLPLFGLAIILCIASLGKAFNRFKAKEWTNANDTEE